MRAFSKCDLRGGVLKGLFSLRQQGSIDLFLQNFYPAGKNFGEKKENYPCEIALWNDRVTPVNKKGRKALGWY
jgi:hypothetical protein